MAENENTYDLADLTHKLQGIRFTMFTTHQGEEMRARPITTLEATEDGTLWFFGVRDSESSFTELFARLREERIVP